MKQSKLSFGGGSKAQTKITEAIDTKKE